MIEFSQEKVVEFEKQYFSADSSKYRGMRYGQAFYDFMGLDKCVQDKEYCDKLYNSNAEEAKQLIYPRITS